MNPTSRREVLKGGLALASTVLGLAQFDRMLPAVSRIAPAAAAAAPPRPSGSGVYYWEDLARLGHKGAVRRVQSLGGGTLSYPAGDFELAGFGDEASASLFFPPGVVPWGQGSGRTRFFLAEDSMTSAQRSKIPRTRPGTNPLKVVQVHKGGHPSSPVRAHGFSVHGRDQAGAGFSVLTFAHNPALKVDDVVAAGAVGSLNSPPGETATIAVVSCPGFDFSGVLADGRNTETGARTGAAGISLASSPRGKLRGCGGSYMGHSHGITAWESPSGESWDFTAVHNGTASPGNGHIGTGLNHEQSGGWIHHRPQLGWNTLGDVRLYSNRGNQSAARLEDVVKLDGAKFVVHLVRDQTTRPVLVRCPPVTYA